MVRQFRKTMLSEKDSEKKNILPPPKISMSPEKGQFQKEIINIVVKFSNHHFSGGFGCQFSGVFFFGQLKNRPRGPSNRIYQHICTSERREESIGCSAVFFWSPKKTRLQLKWRIWNQDWVDVFQFFWTFFTLIWGIWSNLTNSIQMVWFNHQ